MEPSVKKDHSNKEYKDQVKLKDMMDESFLLNCLIIDTLHKKEVTEEEKENLQARVVSQSINQLMNISDQLSLDEVMKLIGKEYVKVKYKKVVDTSEIEKIYKKAMSEYIDKTDHLKVKKNEDDEKNTE